MADRTIEDVLNNWWNPVSIRTIHAATADGPVFSADGSLAVIRTDPTEAEKMLELAAWLDGFRVQMAPPITFDKAGKQMMLRYAAERLRTAAALLATPAPADPEGDGDE